MEGVDVVEVMTWVFGIRRRSYQQYLSDICVDTVNLMHRSSWATDRSMSEKACLWFFCCGKDRVADITGNRRYTRLCWRIHRLPACG